MKIVIAQNEDEAIDGDYYGEYSLEMAKKEIIRLNKIRGDDYYKIYEIKAKELKI